MLVEDIFALNGCNPLAILDDDDKLVGVVYVMNGYNLNVVLDDGDMLVGDYFSHYWI